MKFVVKSEVMKELVTLVSAIAEEAKVSFGPKGLKLKIVDTSHVSMAELSIGAKGFVSYECDKERDLGLDMGKLKEVLKLVGPGDTIEWSLNEEKNKMVLKFGYLTRYMGLIDLSGMAEPRVPKLDLPNSAVLAVEEFLKGLNAAGDVTDHVAVTATEGGLLLEADGDTERVEMTLEKDKQAKDVKAGEKSVRSVFPLDYLTILTKAITAPQVTVHVGQEYPMRLTFAMAEGAGEGAYLLAPRIEDA